MICHLWLVVWIPNWFCGFAILKTLYMYSHAGSEAFFHTGLEPKRKRSGTPPKIGSPPGTNFLDPFWKIVPSVDQPHQGKSVHVDGHEVTNKGISGVHRGLFRKLSGWFSSLCLGWPYAAFTKIIVQCTWMQHAVLPGTRLVHCVLLNLHTWIVPRNLNAPPR